MSLANNPERDLYWLIGVIAVLLFILLLVILVPFFLDFSQELKYINCEIRRSYGSERRYWKHKRRKLWLSLIPFVKY